MYSIYVSFILITMIVTGASRSVAVKVLYQLGFEHPLFVTILYLMGQSLSLVVYFIGQWMTDWSWNTFHSRKQQKERDNYGVIELNSSTTTNANKNSILQNRALKLKHSFLSAAYSNIPSNDYTTIRTDDELPVNDLEDIETVVADSITATRTNATHNFHDNNSAIVHAQTVEEEEAELAEIDAARLDEFNERSNAHSSHEEIPISTFHQRHGANYSHDEQLHSLSGKQNQNEESNPMLQHDNCTNNSNRNDPNGDTTTPVSTTTKDECTPQRVRCGSETGLTTESQASATVIWIHSIPWYAKPIVPGVFNLCNAAMRWGSLIYVAASTAEMFISGLELILSVVASKWIRKRQVSIHRWIGVLMVAIGLIVVRIAHSLLISETRGSFNNGAENDHTSNVVLNHHHRSLQLSSSVDMTPEKARFIGDLLIIGQCVMSVSQDIAEELFLQESDFPATLLLGMEGIVGLVIGIPLYVIMVVIPEQLQQDEQLSTRRPWESKVVSLPCLIGLVFLFTLTGIFNIKATHVTSSMTRNVWKNFRTILVWVFGLLLYYSTTTTIASATENNNVLVLGEPWHVPNSFVVLAGFAIMLSGIWFYYTH